MDLQKVFKIIFIMTRIVGGLGMAAGSVLIFFSSWIYLGFFVWACSFAIVNLEAIYDLCCIAWDFIRENI